MGMLQSNASNSTAIQLIFVHHISKDTWKTLVKCLPGFSGLGEERPEPLDVVIGWGKPARPGVQGGAERVRLVSPGAPRCRAIRAGSPQWGLF